MRSRVPGDESESGSDPCLATVVEQARQLGRRWAAASVAIQLVVAWVLAVAVLQVGRLL